MHTYVIALDQGTTSSRAVLFDESARIVAMKSYEFEQIYPQPGWVEHDPAAILNTQVDALREVVRISGVPLDSIAAIGITNQRETTLLWDRKTGRPLHNAIVWQCRRTAPIVARLCEEGLEKHIKSVTGLVPDAYFSGSKLSWLLDRLGLHERAERGEICFGTVDSFLAWHLVTGRPHVTDATNAGRTMLFNLQTQDWDEELLNMLDIPRACLPDVVDSSQVIGMLDPGILGRPIPVAAMAGDQHASLFGQACLQPGMVKNTYGTGCFMLMNTGSERVRSQNGLLSTMAWRIDGKPTYALEGSVFMGGATIQWLRDEMKMIATAAESEGLAKSVKDTGGVYLVPAFTGLGAPWWDMYSRGTLIGMTRALAYLSGYDPDLEVNISFDDSIIEDSSAKKDDHIKLVSAGLESKVSAIADIRKCSLKEAEAELGRIAKEAQITGTPDDWFDDEGGDGNDAGTGAGTG